MQFTLAEVVEATAGRLVAPGTAPAAALALVVDGATIDSRSTRPGSLFVPIVAERDGHAFIPVAAAAGAVASLLDRSHAALAGADVACVVVADTVAALSALGRRARSRIAGPVVGVTGSVGKTSVKDLTAAALRTTFVTTASVRSFNNELGVPLTLVDGLDGSEAAVIEMGARGPGHISHLCGIAAPTIGVVTCVAPAHLELFGSIDGVAAAKGELVSALPAGPHGTAVLNADDARVVAMAQRTAAAVLTFGTGAAAAGRAPDLVAERVELDERARPAFVARTPWGTVDVRLAVAGAHMVGNALAALGAACAAGVALEAAAAGVAGAALSPWRMEVCTAAGGATVLNDAYNASPLAVKAALRTLLRLGPAGRGRRIAVLGRMAELGAASDDAHRRVAADAGAAGIELYAVGTDQYGVAGERRWADIDDAAAALAAMGLGPDDVVLVKGSRVVGLERLAMALVGAQPVGGEQGRGVLT